MEKWYYSPLGSYGKKRFGPVSSAQLKELAKTGGIGPSDLVWKGGMTKWVPARKIKGLFPSDSSVTSEPQFPSPVSPEKTQSK